MPHARLAERGGPPMRNGQGIAMALAALWQTVRDNPVIGYNGSPRFRADQGNVGGGSGVTSPGLLTRPQTTDQLHATFDRVLDDIRAGKLGRCPTDTGLDPQTCALLNSLAAQTGKQRTVDILACRTEFVYRLDGTHAGEDDREWRTLLQR
jgi:hypothetical protein